MRLRSDRNCVSGRGNEDMQMTEKLQARCRDRFKENKHNPVTCYRCDCGFRSCYKVMKLRTVQKDSRRSRFLCPAHQPQCARYSKYVKCFADEVLKIDSSAAIFWDWHCVPHNTRMSIDATVMHGDRCTSFELDGPQHFNEKNCTRNDADARKDRIVMNSGWSLMRLHHKDKDQWHEYIKCQMAGAACKVVCTAAYTHYLTGDNGEPTVMKLGESS